MALPTMETLDPQLLKQSFDHQDWLFQIKYDGFRSLAYIEGGIEGGSCRLVSRNKFEYTRFATLASKLTDEIDCKNTILDGEICVLDKEGKSDFDALMFNTAAPVYCVFDVLYLNGEDLRELPLVDRLNLLEDLVKKSAESVLFVQSLREEGRALFKRICELDMEGIVGKAANSPYGLVGRYVPWLKIKNPHYSQAEGRGEFFNQPR